MNEALQNLLEIDEKMQTMSSFIRIKMRLESIDPELPAYKKLVEYTDLINRVLTKFAERE
jgi:hypothetical protein